MGYHLVKFDGHRHYDSGDIAVLNCHVILQDHVIKKVRESAGRSLSR